MAKYKILYITPSVRLFGARMSLLTLTSNLNRELFEPIVVCPREGDLVDQLAEKGIRTEIIPIRNYRKGKYFPLIPYVIYKLNNLAKLECPDIIHCNEFWVNPYASWVKRFQGIPIVTHMRLRIDDKRIKNYGLKNADRIICVSNEAAKDFAESSFEPGKVCTVYNGIDLSLFNREVCGEDTRNLLGIRDNDIMITHIALLSPRKRQHIAIEAAKEVVKKHPNAKFFFVGESAKREVEYEYKIKEMAKGFEKNIIFTGFRNDIPQICAASDINLLISSDEGFGRVILEAGAMAVPTIGSNIGGIPEVIEDRKTGMIVPLDDIDALVRSICTMIENPDLRKNMGKAAQVRARNEFSIQQHVKNIEDIYMSIIKNKVS